VSGVMFPSTDGLVLIDGNANTGQIVSRNWVTKDEWLANFTPRSILASVYQDRYLGFYTDELGFTVGFDDPVTGWTELQQEDLLSVDLDTLTGQTLITVTDPLGGPDRICEWDGDTTLQLVYTWKSKPFLQNKPCNFGAIQLRGSFVGSSGGIPIPPAVPAAGYTIGSLPIGGGKRSTLMPIEGTPIYGGSLGGPAPWQVQGILPVPPAGSSSVGVAVKVYADGNLTWFGEIDDERPYRMPSGFKATKWEVEVQGVSPIFSITLADTIKTLESLP
jgi:hypothetical protein